MADELRRDSSGFRLRGLAATRIETFTDAAFAFALTLLVISLDPLTEFGSLMAGLEGIPPFLASASMLMLFWWGHHEWSRRYGMDDFVTFILSCCLVFTVLIYVYPLRFVFSLMQSWICQLADIKLTNAVVIESPEVVNKAFVIYGAGFSAMAGVLLLLHVHSWRQRDALQLDTIERFETRAVMGVWTILLCAGALSTMVALTLPSTMAGFPGWIYAALGVVMPIYGAASNRRRAALLKTLSS